MEDEMKAKALLGMKLAAAWITSLFATREVSVIWTARRRHGVRRFRHGIASVMVVPLLAGAAFEDPGAAPPAHGAAGAAGATMGRAVASTAAPGPRQRA